VVKSSTETVDRFAIRRRPQGFPLMHQNWGKLLFMHWRIDEAELRRLIPSQLSIDTFDGSAWIGVVPFTMWGIRASFLPPIPGTSAFHELNVRTYVHYRGVPGVWFFSLDATHSLAIWGARTFYHLPYFKAQMELAEAGKTIDYSSRRMDDLTYAKFFSDDKSGFGGQLGATAGTLPNARLKVIWSIGAPLPAAAPESLEFFLTERYCLYSYDQGRLYRCRIFHEPWPLQTAKLNSLDSTMIESLGLETPGGDPVLHYAEEIAVDIWGLKRV
jgi:uncharacterized protein